MKFENQFSINSKISPA